MQPTVLLTNDDGPPDTKLSPFVWGLYKHLRQLGWNIKVVLPSSQKSWIGKAFLITEITKGYYYYPTEPDGMGEVSPTSRPLREGEVDEWVLLNGTPATCSNIALHNLYQGQIDLVISGPNLGRNTSSAFIMSSGTVGAALSGSLCKVPSIAVSYGIVQHPPPPIYTAPAHTLATKIVQQLHANWGIDADGNSDPVDLYNVNIPLVEALVEQDEDKQMKVYWTRMWRNAYGRLFKPVPPDTPEETIPAGPGTDTTITVESPSNQSGLTFKFAPDMTNLIPSSIATIPAGTDGWAIHNGHASITPLSAAFAEPTSTGIGAGRIWKMKL